MKNISSLQTRFYSIKYDRTIFKNYFIKQFLKIKFKNVFVKQKTISRTIIKKVYKFYKKINNFFKNIITIKYNYDKYMAGI